MVLKLPADIFAVITKIFKICVILLATKGFSNLFDSSSESFAKLREKLNFDGNDTTINFFSKVAKALIYIIAGFILITELGYNLGGLATGLGISSVVIALADEIADLDFSDFDFGFQIDKEKEQEENESESAVETFASLAKAST